jgi:HAMP domain-containing protein
MASGSEDPEAAADRLEAALERIAQAATRDEAGQPAQSAPANTEEIAARIDGLIDRLRTALGSAAD